MVSGKKPGRGQSAPAMALPPGPAQTVPSAFARAVVQMAGQIALARAQSMPKPTGPPLKPDDLVPVDSKAAKAGLASRVPFYLQGQMVMLERERDLPAGSIVIHAEDIRLAIQLLGLQQHVRRDTAQKDVPVAQGK